MTRALPALALLALLSSCAGLPETQDTPSGSIEDEALTLQRSEMVRSQAEARGIHAEKTLQALRRVPRHLFAPEAWRHLAYADRALPLGPGREMPPAWQSAALLEALELRGMEKVLELGAGLGYQAALLADLGLEVYAVEESAELSRQAQWSLRQSGADTVSLRNASPAQGWPERAPFERILITQPGPDPESLASQVALGGLILEAPQNGSPVLTRWRRLSQTGLLKEFVPVHAR